MAIDSEHGIRWFVPYNLRLVAQISLSCQGVSAPDFLTRLKSNRLTELISQPSTS